MIAAIWKAIVRWRLRRALCPECGVRCVESALVLKEDGYYARIKCAEHGYHSRLWWRRDPAV
jgi:uncharacterized radical SAM superfamily Fe-S cluster-containing enzyme